MKEIILSADMYDIIAYHLGFDLVNKFEIINTFGNLKFIKGEIKEEKKMTREEAIKLAKKFGNEKPWYEDTICLLEALGLIKFEEEKKEEKKEKNLNVAITPFGMVTVENSLIIKHLKEQGYTVTKNG